jgi:hypothetical protein
MKISITKNYNIIAQFFASSFDVAIDEAFQIVKNLNISGVVVESSAGDSFSILY